ncbi:MAG: hypothetical protein OHK0013_48360 [Sandaracinaceae bacterium]
MSATARPAAGPVGSTSIGTASPRPRAGFVDWLRLVASVQMIQGHAIDALLADAHRSGAAFDAWTWARGLTAPAFLVASGLSFHLATRLDDEARYASFRATPGARRRRVVRAGWLIVLGTLLHALDGPWIVDVLQCVGATLLLLDACVSLSPRRSGVLAACACLGALAVALALPLASLEGEGAMRFVVSWVSRREGSLFPLTPWAAYVLFGALLGRLCLPHGADTPPARTVGALAGCAAVALVASPLLEAWIGAPDAETYAAHPSVVATRFGAVCALAAPLVALASRVALPAWGRTLAGETLALYVVHLLVLYAEGIGPGRVFAHAWSLPASVAAAIVLAVVSALAALGWARRWPPFEARWMPWLRGSRVARSSTAGRGAE